MFIEDATLLEELVEGDAGRTRELLERLLPLMEQALRRRWPALETSHRDIIGACGVVLVQWRAELRAGRGDKLHLHEPIATQRRDCRRLAHCPPTCHTALVLSGGA